MTHMSQWHTWVHNTHKWTTHMITGLKEDTIKFYNEMDAISNTVAQALCDMMGCSVLQW